MNTPHCGGRTTDRHCNERVEGSVRYLHYLFHISTQFCKPIYHYRIEKHVFNSCLE